MIRKLLIAAAGGLALTVVGGSAAAQERLPDQPASPRSLPGDNLPPFNMLDANGKFIPQSANLGPPPHRGPSDAPESTAVGPGQALSMRLVAAAVAACKKKGYDTGAAVVDSAGDARAMLTADGSDGSHVFVAQRKAITALAFNAPGSEALKMVKSGKGLDKVTPAMFVMEGGMPIVRGGKLIGALGVSGARGITTDEDCAREALQELAPQLK